MEKFPVVRRSLMTDAVQAVAPLIVALCTFACANSPTLVDGVYEVEASVGEATVPAQLELIKEGAEYRGRLTVMLGSPFHVALGSSSLTGDTVLFSTSSPATSLAVTFRNDTLRGQLMLGGRAVDLIGTRVEGAIVSSDLEQQVALAPFAQSAISDVDRGAAFPSLTPEGAEIYFSSFDADFGFQTIVVSHLQDGVWTQPEVSTFSGTHSDRSPAVSPSGTQLVFASKRPTPGQTDARESYDLWEMVSDPDGSWGEPRHMSEINSTASDYQPSVTADDALYFTSEREGGLGGQDIYLAHPGGRIENLGAKINTDQDEMSAFISPDASYIIFSTSANREGHVGNDDIYVSFNQDGEWTEPRNLGQPINSFANEYGAFVSRDGEYLYFTSDRHPPTDIYRVEVRDLLTRR